MSDRVPVRRSSRCRAPKQAARDKDIVITATNSREPVL